jgi:hypothetical protein
MTGIVPAVVLVLVTAAVPLDSTVSAPPVTVTAVNRAAPFVGALTVRVSAGTAILLQPSTVDGRRVLTGNLTGIAVQDSRYEQPGWTLTGHASAIGPVAAADLGWAPALAAGSDAEGTVTAGPAVQPRVTAPKSNGLAVPGAALAAAAAGNGLGTERVGAVLRLWLPDTTPAGALTGTLTLTLTSL